MRPAVVVIPAVAKTKAAERATSSSSSRSRTKRPRSLGKKLASRVPAINPPETIRTCPSFPRAAGKGAPHAPGAPRRLPQRARPEILPGRSARTRWPARRRFPRKFSLPPRQSSPGPSAGPLLPSAYLRSSLSPFVIIHHQLPEAPPPPEKPPLLKPPPPPPLQPPPPPPPLPPFMPINKK